ncbi:MAG: hypothetical protein RPU42_00365 [Candidatus Sedimenticola sp. (ex Thyasira tokunagai)]
MKIAKSKMESETFQGEFRPTPKRMKEITEKGRELLENGNIEELNKFPE